MKMIDCFTAEKLIVRDLDEGLETGERGLLQTHLQDCPHCSCLRDETMEILRSVAADLPAQLSEDFWRQSGLSLAASLAEREAPGRWKGVWKYAVAMAAACLSFLVIRALVIDGLQPAGSVDGETALVLIQDLNQVYGPSPDERGHSGWTLVDQDMEVSPSRMTQYDAASAGWFEIEDEPNNLLL